MANRRKDYNGFDVAIVHVNDMNGPPPNYDCVYEYYSRPTHYQSIRDFISDVYTNGKANHTGDGHLGYILLVGDNQDDNSNEMLPAAYPTYYGSDEQAGDYYYACTGGDSDDFLDVMYGRLSVGNETELSNNVNKIISYETNSNGNWCDKATLVNGCKSLYNTVDPTMKQLTEIIPPTTPKYYAYRKLDTDPLTVVTEAQIFGQQFSASDYADPTKLCGADLLDSWCYDNGNAGVNNRIHTWIYEGHGMPRCIIDEGCGRHIFKIENCSGVPDQTTMQYRLNNNFYPFMIFNCCSAGQFDWGVGDCMAEVFMNIANKGAIGVLASARESDGGGFGVTDGTVLNAMYCSFSQIMGEAVMESKLNIDQEYRRQFNLYGDPALNLWPVGYTVTESLILSGTVQISNNITIAPGVYLYIQPNTKLRFVNGASLIVNGTLTTGGYSSNMITFDFISPNSSTQNGIKFNSSSSNSELIYCNIKNAYTGVYCNGSNTLPVINNCVISNNTIGIRLNGVLGSNTQFFNNKITNNSYYGIELYNSSPTNMYNDTISYNGYYGVLCESGSSPYLTYNIIKNQSTGAGLFCNGASPHLNSCSGDLSGHNVIKLNGSGISAAYGSTVWMGTATAHGVNSVYSNTNYAAIAAYGTVINAQYDYWGSNPQFSIQSGCSIDTAHYYPYPNDPNSGRGKTVVTDDWELEENTSGVPINQTIAVTDTTPVFDAEFGAALDDINKGKYDDAIIKYTQKYKKEKSYNKKQYALTQLAECYRLAKHTDFVDFLDKEIRPNLSKNDELYAITLELENLFLIADGEYNKAIENYYNLKNNFTGNERANKLALFNLCHIYFDDVADIIKAKDCLNELKAKYPDDDLTLLCMVLLGEITTPKRIAAPPGLGKGESDKKVETPDKYDLFENYPNPFNPTTSIGYQIPQEGFVTIKIFDVIGREVASLVNQNQKAGKYTAEFNAANLSSGLYIYQLKVNDFISTKKMMLLK